MMLPRVTTRSRAALSGVSGADENVHNLGVKLGASTLPGKITGKRPQIEEVGKAKAVYGAVHKGRNALGDITNNHPEPSAANLAKKPSLKVKMAAPSLALPINVPNHQAQGQPSGSHGPATDVVPELRERGTVSLHHLEVPFEHNELLDVSVDDADMEPGDDHTNQTVQLEGLMLKQHQQQHQHQQAAASTLSSHSSSSQCQGRKLCPYDLGNMTNPQAVIELIPEVMAHLRRSEQKHLVNSNYMTVVQNDINPKMREILLDWLNEVHQKFKLRQETLYLTVTLIDKFLEKKAVSRSKLQLVGCTAMLLASKYEEIYAPEVRDFVYISDNAYTREQILAMESIMLSTLQFFLTLPTCFRFAERYWRVAQTNDDQTHLVNYLMELTLQDYSFLRHPPSKVAASALYLALKLTGSRWTPMLESQTEYSEDSLRDCVMEMHSVAANEQSKYRAVRKKYSSRKFNEVSKMNVNLDSAAPTAAFGPSI